MLRVPVEGRTACLRTARISPAIAFFSDTRYPPNLCNENIINVLVNTVDF